MMYFNTYYLKLVLTVIAISGPGVGQAASPGGSVLETRQLRISKESLYMVWVVTVWEAPRGRAYREVACTGTLIRDDLVLTLASCLLYDDVDNPDPAVTVAFQRPHGQRLQALKIYVNPNYYSEDKYESKAHDFALIMVEKSRNNVYPHLPRERQDFEDIKDTCIMGGYGADTKKPTLENFKLFRLNDTRVEILRGRACHGGQLICLHFLDLMPCEADLGTPLVCDGTLYALYVPRQSRRSLTTKCLDMYITSFSLVYNVAEWVTQILDAPTSNLEWLNNPWYVLLMCCVIFTLMGTIYYGLVEFLQRTFDPAEGLQMQPLPIEEDKEDEDSWFESQWVTKP